MDNNIDIKINLNRTTFQMTESFQKNENVKILPMDLFYGWNDNDLSVIDDLKNKVLCLPFYGDLDKEILNRIYEGINYENKIYTESY